MEMIKTIIIDDEERAIVKLQNDLSVFPEIEILKTTTSIDTAKRALQELQPDLLFLDIEMPEMSGLDLLNEVRVEIRKSMRVVFYTGHNKYLIDAVRMSAFDYLPKLYQSEELKEIIKRIQTDVPCTDFNQSFQDFVHHDNKFAIQAVSGLMFIPHYKVLLFQYIKEQRSWFVRLTNNKTHKLKTNTTAQHLISLHPSFIQINQNSIINSDYLLSIENGTRKCHFYPPYNDINDQDVSAYYYRKLKDLLDIV